MILVTGATGTVGSEVVANLCSSGAPVRALVRSPEKADTLRGYDCDVAIGDFGDPESLAAALRGVSKVFLLSPPGPRQVEQETAVLSAVGAAGTQPHVVKLAPYGYAADDRPGLFASHGQVVHTLRGEDLPWTIVTGNAFFQNLLGSAASIQEQGVLATPAGDARVSHVDARDVAAVAAHILTTDGHEGEEYVVTGPAALGFDEVAATIGTVVSKDVRYVAVTADESRAALTGAGLPEQLAQALVDVYLFYARGGAAVVTDEVQKATGKPPLTLEQFVRDHRGAFA